MCGPSLAENVGLNPAGDMDVSRFGLLCFVRKSSPCRADHSSRESCRVVSGCDREASIMKRPWHTKGFYYSI